MTKTKTRYNATLLALWVISPDLYCFLIEI